MQVSWIDPDEVRGLLQQLQGPGTNIASSAWEVNTLPVVAVEALDIAPLTISTLTAAEVPPPEEAPLDDDDVKPHLPNAELWRIRERLRNLREKAVEAGILSKPPALPVEPAREERPDPPAEAAPPPIQPISGSPFGFVNTAEYEPLFGLPVGTAGATPAPPPPVLVTTPAPSVPDAEAEKATEPSFTTSSSLGLSDRLNEFATWACALLGTQEVLLVDDYGDILWGGGDATGLVLSAMMAWQSSQRASPQAACVDPGRIDKTLDGNRALSVLPVRTRYGVVSLAVIAPSPVKESEATSICKALVTAVEGLP